MGKFFGATSAMLGRICPPGWNRVKVSENLGATTVVLVAHAVTSLNLKKVVKTKRLMTAIKGHNVKQ